jgi:cell division protein FtsL
MRKSSKPLIVLIASVLIISTIMVLLSQGLRFKYEEQQRELAQLENQIKTENTVEANLKANYQMLISEDFIKKFASEQLGLVDADIDSESKITIYRDDVIMLAENMEEADE